MLQRAREWMAINQEEIINEEHVFVVSEETVYVSSYVST